MTVLILLLLSPLPPPPPPPNPLPPPPQQAVVQIVREKFLSRAKTKDQADRQAFLNELYVFLTDEMHTGMKKVCWWEPHYQTTTSLVPSLSPFLFFVRVRGEPGNEARPPSCSTLCTPIYRCCPWRTPPLLLPLP